MSYFDDHALPLVQLKERRRDLVVSLAGHRGPISNTEIAEIASVQQTIAAMEAVVGDLDSQIEFKARPQMELPFEMRKPRTGRTLELVFGRREEPRF